jgi:hypothetical protein
MLIAFLPHRLPIQVLLCDGIMLPDSAALSYYCESLRLMAAGSTVPPTTPNS